MKSYDISGKLIILVLLLFTQFDINTSQLSAVISYPLLIQTRVKSITRTTKHSPVSLYFTGPLSTHSLIITPQDYLNPAVFTQQPLHINQAGSLNGRTLKVVYKASPEIFTRKDRFFFKS